MTENTEETQVNVTPEVLVYVPLFKNIYETSGKKLVSYKPGYIPKGSPDIVKTFPIGLGIEYETVQDWDFTRQEYTKKFWTSVAVNDNKKTEKDPDVYVTLNEVDTKDYTKIGLTKTSKEWKISFTSGKPIEIAGNRYRITISKNTKEDKKHDMNLIFKESQWGEISWSETEISFESMDF